MTAAVRLSNGCSEGHQHGLVWFEAATLPLVHTYRHGQYSTAVAARTYQQHRPADPVLCYSPLKHFLQQWDNRPACASITLQQQIQAAVPGSRGSTLKATTARCACAAMLLRLCAAMLLWVCAGAGAGPMLACTSSCTLSTPPQVVSQSTI